MAPMFAPGAKTDPRRDDPGPVTRSFTYSPNLGDNFHGVVLGLWGTRARTIRSGLTCLMFGVFAALLLWFTGMPPGSVAPAALVFAVAWGLFITAGIGGWQAWLITRRQREIGPAEIRVGDEGIERSTRKGNVRHSWEAITWVEETHRAFFLYDATQPVFAIEKSAVGSGRELASLREYLRSRKPGSYRAPQ